MDQKGTKKGPKRTKLTGTSVSAQTLPPDLLKPTHHGKVYNATKTWHYPRKERVPVTLEFPEKQRVSQPSITKNRRKFVLDQSVTFKTTATPSSYGAMYNRYRAALKQKCNTRIGWSDIFKDMSPAEVQQWFVKMDENDGTCIVFLPTMCIPKRCQSRNCHQCIPTAPSL